MASLSSATQSVVSTSLLQSIDKVTVTFEWLCVPQHMLILDDSMSGFWMMMIGLYLARGRRIQVP